MTLRRPPDQRGCLGAALNLAEDTFELDFVVHIPGRCSTVANELPRYFQREVSRTQPKILEDRHPRWWETAVDPNTTHEGRGAADDETAESHRLCDASFACHPWDMKREGYLDSRPEDPRESAEAFEAVQHGSCHLGLGTAHL